MNANSIDLVNTFAKDLRKVALLAMVYYWVKDYSFYYLAVLFILWALGLTLGSSCKSRSFPSA